MLRVRAVFTGLPGLPGVSTFFFNGSDEGQAQVAADAVAAFYAEIADNFTTSMLISVDDLVDSVDPSDGEILAFRTTETAPVAGTAVSETLPFASQGLIRFRTNTVRRSRRVVGRTFLPGLYIGISENGVMNPPNQAQLTAAALEHLGGTQSGVEHLVYSRPTDTIPGSVAPVTGYDTWAQLAVLTSRRP